MLYTREVVFGSPIALAVDQLDKMSRMSTVSEPFRRANRRLMAAETAILAATPNALQDSAVCLALIYSRIQLAECCENPLEILADLRANLQPMLADMYKHIQNPKMRTVFRAYLGAGQIRRRGNRVL